MLERTIGLQRDIQCSVASPPSGSSWWRHRMEIFSALLALCAGNSPVTGEFPTQRPVTRSFGVFFDLRLSKRLSKQSWGWWSETPSPSFWRHCNVSYLADIEAQMSWQSRSHYHPRSNISYSAAVNREFGDYIFKIIIRSLSGQWVNHSYLAVMTKRRKIR